MGLSNRRFAALAGVSEGAVRKARADRIKGAILADGTIDADRALQLWGKNTDPSMQRKAPPPADASGADNAAAPVAPAPGKAPAGPDVSIARTMLIVEKAKREQIKRKREEGSSLERAPTVSLTQTLAREFRDGLMGFPDMHYAQMASELLVACRSSAMSIFSSMPAGDPRRLQRPMPNYAASR